MTDAKERDVELENGVPWRVRLAWEVRWCYAMYSLEEPPVAYYSVECAGANNGGDGSYEPPVSSDDERRARAAYRKQRLRGSASLERGKMVDLSRCLAPYHPIRIPLLLCSPTVNMTPVVRLLLLAWSVQVLLVDLWHYPPHNLWIYMGYLTHWGHVLNVTYLACSLCCSLRPSTVSQPRPDETGTLSPLARMTWSLYALAAPLGIAIALLYWSALVPLSGVPEYGLPLYISGMEHGMTALFVIFDGAVVGSVPVRAKHFVYVLIVSTLYLIWSFADSVLGIGNGEWGPAYQDDSLYPVLDWADDPRIAGFVSAFAILVLDPLCFWSVWMLSLSAPRQEEEVEDVTRKKTCFQTCCCCCTLTCCSNRKWDGSNRPIYCNLDQNDATYFDASALV